MKPGDVLPNGSIVVSGPMIKTGTRCAICNKPIFFAWKDGKDGKPVHKKC